MAALASEAGVLDRLLDARWPHEQAPLEAIALEAQELREAERADLARLIRNQIADLLDKSM